MRNAIGKKLKKKNASFFFMKIWTRRKGKKWMVKTQTKKEKKLKEEGNKRKKQGFLSREEG